MTNYAPCGSANPDNAEMTCVHEDGDRSKCRLWHTGADGTTWPSSPEDRKAKVDIKTRKPRPAEQRNGEPDPTDPYDQRRTPSTPEPLRDEQWIAQSLTRLEEFCLHRQGRFTTADVWPLLDNPASNDRRVMLHVRKEAVRRGWMEETGEFVRVKEATTHDGVTFPMGAKPIPYFRSLVCTKMMDWG